MESRFFNHSTNNFAACLSWQRAITQSGLGKKWDFTGSPEETCHDAERSYFLGKDVERACRRGKEHSRESLILGRDNQLKYPAGSRLCSSL